MADLLEDIQTIKAGFLVEKERQLREKEDALRKEADMYQEAVEKAFANLVTENPKYASHYPGGEFSVYENVYNYHFGSFDCTIVRECLSRNDIQLRRETAQLSMFNGTLQYEYYFRFPGSKDKLTTIAG